MGRPKALLPCGPGGETFVGALARAMTAAGLPRVVIVGRQTDEVLRTHVAALPVAAVFAGNRHPERGQLSSLLVGIEYAEARGAEAVLVMPVDIPLVRADTLARVGAEWQTNRPAIARAVHRGRHGHPVVFGREVFDARRDAEPRRGAKAVLASHAAAILDVEVDDPAVLRDVDRPEDYAALFGTDA
jgi:CTP:molybdopterin cytidylyltransferase MocA